MRALVIRRGDRFGRLAVIKEVAKRGGMRCFRLRCDCGKTTVVRLSQLRNGTIRSCGCLRIETTGNRRRTHGRSTTAEFHIWQGMLQRCGYRRHKSYADYGGRGIAVCERWRKFENFLADMGERPSDDHEIDRIDNDGNYEPGNVRWIDRTIQMRNRRKRKTSTSRYRGVDWWNGQAWRARISIGGKVRDLGVFDSEETAARAYDAVARQHGGFRLNFPDDKED